MKERTTLILILAISFVFSTFATEQPPNAVPGKCYAKSFIPDRYETIKETVVKKMSRFDEIPATYKDVTEQVLVKNAYTILEKIPAVYDTVRERVLIKEGYKIEEIIPATYEWTEEMVVIKAAYNQYDTLPAVYEKVTEIIEIEPATTRWTSKKANNCYSSNPDDCLVWYFEDVPAKTKTIIKEVLKSTPTIKATEIPAQYEKIKKQVIKTPARTNEITIPAEYVNITKLVLLSPAKNREVVVPATYKTITKRVIDQPSLKIEIPLPDAYETIEKKVLVREGNYYRWQEVLCESDRTNEVILKIQMALRDKGYKPGIPDGFYGSQTINALIEFQKANDLPEGQLDTQTLKALGVE